MKYQIWLGVAILFCTLLSGCSEQANAATPIETVKNPFEPVVKRELAESDPLVLALVLASQPGKSDDRARYTNDMKAVVLQQAAVGWAAAGEEEKARWSFLKAVDHARKSHKKNGSRLRGLAQSCIESAFYDEALEAARYLRVEDRVRVQAMVARALATDGQKARALELVNDAKKRLEDNQQAGGLGKRRALRAIGLAYKQLGQAKQSTSALLDGCQLSSDSSNGVVEHLDVGRLLHEVEKATLARYHASQAKKLVLQHPDGTQLVLTALLLNDIGLSAEAESLLERLPRRDQPQLITALVRMGLPRRALDVMRETHGADLAEALKLSSEYFTTAAECKEIRILARGLRAKDKDWKVLQALAELCARSGDSSSAISLYEASLKAHMRDWPEQWEEANYKALVLSNLGRARLEAGLTTVPIPDAMLQELTSSLEWPQVLDL